MFPSRFRCQSIDGKIAFHFKLHCGATDKLHEPLVGWIAIKQHGVDLFTVAGVRDITAVDSHPDRSRGPVPVDALDVGSLRLIPARLRIRNGVVDPALIYAVHDAMQFFEVVVAVGVDKQFP